jgi:two-component system sensor histidine kinase RegB
MGLLASGAAHELGTPLSTLAVILGDWTHDEELMGDEVLREDIEEMRTQVQRCKSIVSGILLSAGEARGEESEQTTVCKFVDALAEEWRTTRTMPAFSYRNDFGEDTPMVSDTTLKQMAFNVLDNARDASPQWVELVITRDDTAEVPALCITVNDAGPGFAPGMLDHLGEPYQSTKQRPGSGLGLYLVMNVARTLGGSVTARNRAGNGEGSGAQVSIRLPLAAIALPRGHRPA